MIKLETGEIVYYQGSAWEISKVSGLTSVLICNKKTGKYQSVKIAELQDKPVEEVIYDPDIPIEAISDKKLQRAEMRYNIIKPFLSELRGDKTALTKVAKAHGLSPSTLYRWLKNYRTFEDIRCLVDDEAKGGKGKSRLDKVQEDLISSVIEDVYLKGSSFNKTFEEIVNRFSELNLEVPHPNTVRRRINLISERERNAKRLGPRTAAQQHDPKPGSTPGANAPLALVQIDHTQLDIFMVDEVERKAFKRPWITVLIDVFSRVILGFYISYDPPGAFAVGRAIAHAILLKDNYLKSIGLENVEWPCYGKMVRLHCDNAKEFRGAMLRENCANYKITLKFRPVKKPEYGGHIERLMGTISAQLKDLAGATKVSPEMRKNFKPEKTASFTISEFEQWFALWVTNVYHQKAHEGLHGISPLSMWEAGLKGGEGHPGIGMPQILTDERKLKLDFLPRFERTIQRTGVYYRKLQYYSEALKRWISAKDETIAGKNKPKRKFTFRFDPRNISSILFLDPIDSQYREVQSVLNIKPDIMSIWDYRQSVRKLKESHRKIDQNSIYASFKELRKLEQLSINKTAEMKKRQERQSRMKRDPVIAVKNESEPIVLEVPPTFDTESKEIKPFDEIEINPYVRSFS
ncbi:MAG TPA: Mu transposase C-terminal domain-containing protein [Cyclobacteriaceae bacterium]|nr:DDE-type integrase/transposase/recombinase [Cyclobacteriaceae bacterium]HRK55681.1 Mu transposase C-terminal domain-containing protein [Cyclobacteriaceae bacterium]